MYELLRKYVHTYYCATHTIHCRTEFIDDFEMLVRFLTDFCWWIEQIFFMNQLVGTKVEVMLLYSFYKI